MEECIPKTDLVTLKSRWDREGVVCIRNAFEHHADMVEAAGKTETFADARVPSRTSQCLPDSHPIASGVRADGEFNRLYEHLHGYPLANDHFPTEYRVYGEGSNGMKAHRDLVMFDRPQTEMVYTTHNDSDSQFHWTDSEGKQHSFSPQPNDVVLVKANGPVHGVTPLTQGTRGIVKFLGHAPGSVPNHALRIQKEMCPEK